MEVVASKITASSFLVLLSFAGANVTSGAENRGRRSPNG